MTIDEVSLPELRRVADGLSNGQSLQERSLRLVPLAAGEGDLSRESPALDHILARVGARGDLQALVGELPRPGRFATGQPELPQAGKEVHRVTPLHPLAGRRMVRQTVNAIEELLGQRQVALHKKDIAQV